MLSLKHVSAAFHFFRSFTFRFSDQPVPFCKDLDEHQRAQPKADTKRVRTGQAAKLISRTIEIVEVFAPLRIQHCAERAVRFYPTFNSLIAIRSILKVFCREHKLIVCERL